MITRRPTKAFLILSALAQVAPAQLAPVQHRDRLAGHIDNRKYIILRGSRNPRIDNMTDQGPLDDAERIAGLSLRFKPSAQQAAELDQLLTDQQNPASPLYHAWLTPEEFGDRFGLSQSDLTQVTEWLSAQGFQVDAVARSRTHVVFSGGAGQVRATFRTALHRFRDDGGAHYANLSEIAVPSDLAPLIYTVKGLDNFRLKPGVKLRPLYQSSSGTSLAGPGDLATIYNVNPLYQKGIDGSGQKIAVIGQSAVKMSDVRTFRKKFSLPDNDPEPILIPGFPDPGFNDDLMEAEMDVEIAGATAPKATILFVYSEHVYYATQYAVDQNLAPVISHSYGVCEKALFKHLDEIDAWRSIAKQANAQGITW
ncbi:MAG TPA: protease pro-enzyme activation domain-containing protein, partial [Candidatus Solibacter sp.]|nr:protease pro-enzyme activation domain-containing protein [Candidatus Solibacter sp.]